MHMTGEDDLHYEGWRVASASALGVFVSFASIFIYTFGIFLKPIAQEYHWSREAVSSAFGFAAIMVAVASPAIGYLLDRFEPRRIILPCLLVFGLAFASLSTLTPHLWHLYGTFVVLGLVGNGTAQMAYARALGTWFEARRGTALAIMMAGGAVGAMVLPPLTQALIVRVGWRNTCVALGVIPLAVGLPTIAAFVRERPRPRVSETRTTPGATVAEGLASRVFWLLLIVLFCASVAQNGTIAHLAALLTDRGVSAGEAAIAMAAMGAASLVGRLVTGWLLDRFFAASRLRDLTALRTFSTVVFEPASDGIITSYEITGVVARGAKREVSISAPVKMFDGRTVSKRLAITIEGGQVTAISELGASPSPPPR